MSIRIEQYRSLLETREFLFALLDPSQTPRVPRAVRERASWCLRHFPFLRDNGEPEFSQDSIGLDGDKNPDKVSGLDRATNHAKVAQPGNESVCVPVRSGLEPSGETGELNHIGDATGLVPYVGPGACPMCRGRRVSEPSADFLGDDPKTMRVCTVSLCQLCGGSGRDPNWRRIVRQSSDATGEPSGNPGELDHIGDATDMIEDGLGNSWPIVCPTCGRRSMQVVRPGKAQCGYCG